MFDSNSLDDLEVVEDYMVAPSQPTRGFQPTQPQGDNVPYDVTNGGSPKGTRKASTKRWRTWGWKYSPSSGKSMSIEEEPESPKKSASSSRHSSPKDSPSRTRNGSPSASPVRRKKTPSPRDSPTRRAEVRSSAGARLYQTIEDRNLLLDDSGDELQALLESVHSLKHTVRPASVHVGQSNSGLLK